jgi:DNA polymerase V
LAITAGHISLLIICGYNSQFTSPLTHYIMSDNNFFIPLYKGSKEFSQEDIHTANATGFGAAADDYAERGIDLNEQLIRNKPATFFMRVNSPAMIDAGIHEGDVVIVDRSLKPGNGKIIIAVVDGEMLLRRLVVTSKGQRLSPANSEFAIINIDNLPFETWGVVTYVIHSV